MLFRSCPVYNGQERYDGSTQYNALRNYKINIVAGYHIGIFILQRFVYSKNYLRMLIQNKIQTSTLFCIFSQVEHKKTVLQMAGKNLIKLNVTEKVRHNSQILYTQMWYKNILNVWQRYRNKIQNSKAKVVGTIETHMEINNPCGQIGNMQIITQRNVAYYDGTLRYDGTAKYDALYKEERVE